MTFEVRRIISADHPSLPGHFPGAPIVPGVVILEEVVTALTEWRSNCRVTGISTVKFLAPLKPEQPFTIILAAREHTENEVDFSCRWQDRAIVQGRLLVRRRPS
jgi:3-hydroxymyristoyl/3-hydroxydecanoyl-(acyl carrier protein) dehydratase